MIKTLLQAEHEKHERQRHDERHRLGPLEYDLRGRHGEMLDLGPLGQGDVRRPVLLLDQLLDVAHAVGYHVVEHQRVETGEPLLRQQHFVGEYQEDYLVRHDGEIAHLQEEIFRAVHGRVQPSQETVEGMPGSLSTAYETVMSGELDVTSYY